MSGAGRPHSGLDQNYQLRFTSEDRAAWEAKAKEARLTLSQWIRMTCLQASGGSTTTPPPAPTEETMGKSSSKKTPTTTKNGRKIGRPNPSGEKGMFHMLVTDEDREVWEKCAQASGLHLAQWARYHLARVAGGAAAVVGVEFRTSYPPHDPTAPIPQAHVDVPALDRKARDLVEAVAITLGRFLQGDPSHAADRPAPQGDLRGMIEAFIDQHADRVLAQELRARLDEYDHANREDAREAMDAYDRGIKEAFAKGWDEGYLEGQDLGRADLRPDDADLAVTRSKAMAEFLGAPSDPSDGSDASDSSE